MTKNKYIGSTCDCMNDDNNDDCKHSHFITDQSVIDKFYEFIQSNESVAPDSESYNKIKSLDNQELERKLAECDHLVMDM